MTRTTIRLLALAIGMAVLAGACATSETGGNITLYTSVTQGTVDAVLAGLAQDYPDLTVELFRAPTGALNARIAAEQREGGIQADVLWLTDPLSMQQYDADGLLAEFTPDELSAIPAEYRSERFWGTRLLSMVIVQQQGLEVPLTGWADLADPAHAEAIVLPDPGFAGSAFGAMGYLALADGFGFDFYTRLAQNGAVQVSSPGEVVTGVAEGQFHAGMTLAFSARTAVDKGSPIEIVWPEPGAIVMYSPIAVIGERDLDAAGSFVDFVLSSAGQEAIAGTGWQPVRADVAWALESGPAVTPDWSALFNRQDELLDEYRSIFGG